MLYVGMSDIHIYNFSTEIIGHLSIQNICMYVWYAQAPQKIAPPPLILNVLILICFIEDTHTQCKSLSTQHNSIEKGT